MTSINYVRGDVREGAFIGTRVIPHVCNNINKMGAGVAKALYTKWPTVKETYHKLDFSHPHSLLGHIQLFRVEDNTLVCNMIGQHKVMVRKKNGVPINDEGDPPVRYAKIETAMVKLANHLRAYVEDPIIHAPKFGCGLSGGRWETISQLIEEYWCPHFPVVVFTVD